jgi:hypothetical protein
MSNQVEIIVNQLGDTTVVELNSPGPQGIRGPVGPAGIGSSWRQGDGVPSNAVGTNGDYYLNTDNGDIYGPKDEGVWGSIIFNIAEGQQGPIGDTGENGTELELQVSSTYIQWRYVGEPTWDNLIALTEITGPAGENGGNGENGREIELQKNSTYVQWRYVGDTTWDNLISLEEITGPPGEQGQTGDAGSTVLSGSGAPSNATGNNNDFYIDTTASRIYGPKYSGAWGSGTSLIGVSGVVSATAPLSYNSGTQTISIDVATAGDATASQVVKGNDTRLTDTRTPTAHNQTASTISDSTTAGRALLTAVDAAAQRTSLGLGTAATTASTDYAPTAHVGSGGTAHATATTTVAGFLSAADKTKLDAITADSGTVLLKYVRNDTASSIAKGTPVYITGSSGTTLTIAPSDATDETSSARTIGVTQTAIGSNSNGYIVCVGLLDGINTNALTEGQLIWLSETTGQFTSTQPAQPAHGVICGYCVRQGSGSSGILYIKIDNGYELGELHNVVTTGATTDQALVRESDGLWKNRTVYSSTTPAALGTAAVGTGTTLARADHVHQLPSTTTLGAVSAVTGTSPIASSGGLTPAISITAATTSAAGSMSATDKTKLDGIASGAQVNVATDLSYTASTRLLESSTGTDVTLPLVTSTNAGLAPASGGGTTTYLRADGTWSTAGSPPGGSDTQLQFNDGGAFGGDADLVYNKTSNLLTTKGDVRLDDGGTFTTTLQCITPTAARTISLPDATGTVGLIAGSSGQLIYNNAGAYAGGPLFTSTTGTLGYTAGGAVTQATNKTTGVTLNGASGRITMNSASLALDTTVSFTLTNSSITANDLLILNHTSGGTAGSYLLNAQAAAGSAVINVRNITAAALSEAIVIGFAIIKA